MHNRLSGKGFFFFPGKGFFKGSIRGKGRRVCDRLADILLIGW